METNTQAHNGSEQLKNSFQAIALAARQFVEQSSKESYAELDLSAEELNRAQDFFTHNTQISPTDFWDTTAALRSSLLSKALLNIVDESRSSIIEQLTAAAAQGTQHSLSEVPAEQILMTGGDLQIQELTPTQAFTHSLNSIYRPITDYNQIDRVGDLWQTQLHNEALNLARESRSESNADFILEVQLAETTLMVDAPWIYTDRLLCAFELAHKKIQKHTQQTKQTLTTVFEDLL